MSILLELHDAQDRLIRPIPLAVRPSFKPTLVDDGTGQFALLRSDPMAQKVAEGHIVHVYVDNRDVFQFVIEEISDAYSESEGDLVAYQGRDTRAILDYALIYPDGWPGDQKDPRLPTYGASFLLNGDFQQDGQWDPVAGTGLPAPNWTTYPSASYTYYNQAGHGTEKDEKTGTVTGKSLRVVTTSAIAPTIVASQAGELNLSGRGSRPTTVRFVGAARATALSGPSYVAGARVRWFDHQGTELGTIYDQANQAEAWDRLEQTFAVPATAFTYRVELVCAGQGTFDWDLLRLQVQYDTINVYPAQPSPELATYGANLALNPTFDGVNYGTTVPPHWALQPGVSVGQLYTPTTLVDESGRQLLEGLSVTRQFPAVGLDGLIVAQEIPVDEGRGYHLAATLQATYYTAAGVAHGDGTPGLWFRRVWLDGTGAAVGTASEDRATVPNTWPARRYEFPTRIAPAGASRMRLEVWVPADVEFPVWDRIEVKLGLISDNGGFPPGTVKNYTQKRIANIVQDLVASTGIRLGGAWPVWPGRVELDRDYDVIDGVLVPKDQRNAQFRFDSLGQAVRALANGNGDLTLRPMRPGEVPGVASGFVLDYELQRGVDRSSRVIFREGVDVQAVPERAHSARDLRSKLVVEGVGEGINAVAVEVGDQDLVATYGVREGFLDRKSVTAFIDLRREGQAALAQMATEATAFTITVSTDVWRPFADYALGDSVGVSLPHIGVEGRYRIVAISATPADGGGLDTVEIDLDSAAYDAFTRVAKAQQTSQQSFSASQRFPQGSVTLYQVNQEEDVDDGTPFTFRFWVPSIPVYTNQVRLAWQGLQFRSPVQIGLATIRTDPAGVFKYATGAPSSLPTGQTSDAGGGETLSDTAGGGTTRTVVPSHHHEYRELSHQHPFEVPDHVHQVIAPGIEYGLFLGTWPSGVKVLVNSVELDPSLYPYTDGGAEDLEIGRFIKRGWNTVTFVSRTLGRVNASVVIQAYLSAQLEDLSG